MLRPSQTIFHQTLALGTEAALRRRFMVVDAPLQGNMRFDLLLEVHDNDPAP
ncbi:hypothetical protein [Desulfobulbus alkaliphilus]|uniref:hypothetical protein n=1 Tax=Desulfobulbus alkaliphilus TaxID=869814 RepID=UPI0019649CDD|nr:hypothetical protein [Desulfobulbus alkaliphilus]MBM9536550.1 hypothetical protein [Desulfobulbus alkaliphilus]